MDRPLDRRDFLRRTAALTGLGAAFPMLLTACGGGDGASGADGTAAEVIPAAECDGFDALTAADLNTRQALEYTDVTPVEGQVCANCRFYNGPTTDACGGCQLFKGPVSPGGYCKSWAAVPA